MKTLNVSIIAILLLPIGKKPMLTCIAFISSLFVDYNLQISICRFSYYRLLRNLGKKELWESVFNGRLLLIPKLFTNNQVQVIVKHNSIKMRGSRTIIPDFFINMCSFKTILVLSDISLHFYVENML